MNGPKYMFGCNMLGSRISEIRAPALHKPRLKVNVAGFKPNLQDLASGALCFFFGEKCRRKVPIGPRQSDTKFIVTACYEKSACNSHS